MRWNRRFKLLILLVCLTLAVTGTAIAKTTKHDKNPAPQDQIQAEVPAVQDISGVQIDGTLDVDSIKSTSLVPGEEARYTIAFIAPCDMDLANASLSVYLPESFDIGQNDILDANPGCTLANIQYKNKSTAKYWSVLQGETTVKQRNHYTTFNLTVESSTQASVNSGVTVYLSLPGVTNAPDEGSSPISIILESDSGNYLGQSEFSLGQPPNEVPQDLELQASDSYTFEANWSQVDDATRYQLCYSLDPNGYFIQACDFGYEPSPGQDWNLTETSCSFTSKGNGEVDPGRTYYFKVRAGNEYGFGSFSEVVAAATPVLILEAPKRTIKSPIQVQANQSVEIVDADRILLYKADTGEPVKADVSVEEDIISIVADLDKGNRYQVVFYENALVSTDDIPTYNNLFGFEFQAKSAHKDKGGK